MMYEGHQNAVAILLEKMANDEEEEVDPSVKNAGENQSKVTPPLFRRICFNFTVS